MEQGPGQPPAERQDHAAATDLYIIRVRAKAQNNQRSLLWMHEANLQHAASALAARAKRAFWSTMF
jgi:hypothetical protein